MTDDEIETFDDDLSQEIDSRILDDDSMTDEEKIERYEAVQAHVTFRLAGLKEE